MTDSLSHGVSTFLRAHISQLIRKLFYFVRFGPEKNVSNLPKEKLTSDI
jgi:hypothetical protein